MWTLSHVSFGYGQREVLHDVTFTAPQGDHHCHRGAVRLRQEYHLQPGGSVL